MNKNLLHQPIRHHTDLHRFWLGLMQPLGFAERRLYVVFIGRDHLARPELHEINQIPPRATAEDAEALIGMLDHVSDDFSFAILLARPGRHSMDDDDLTWARELVLAAERLCVLIEPVHFANDAVLVPFAPDDLIE